MSRRRGVQIVGGIVAVLVAVGRVAALGWQLFGRHREEMGPAWKVVSVIIVCAVVAYFGVHLIFGSPAKSTVPTNWDSSSLD
jgi:hypothetical protein